MAGPEPKANLTEPPKRKTPRSRKRFSFLRFFILFFLLATPCAGALGIWAYRELERDVPEGYLTLADYKPGRASRVFSKDGELIGEFYLQKRIVLPYDQIPPTVKNAFVAAEDNRFFEHHGVDPMGILRAAITNLKAGHVVQGGSTITQQVAKFRLDMNERNVFRKIREAILARKMEKRLSKDQILSIYLNNVYLGHGAYGVQAAAEVYFGKDAKDLSIAEAAMLAGLPKAPTQDSPIVSYKRAKDRQRYVLSQMVENKLITEKEAEEARVEPIAIISKDTPLNHTAAPYFVEHIRRIVQAKYRGKEIFRRGLQIYTTLDMKQQRAAEAAVKHGLEEVDRRFGFRGPVEHLNEVDLKEFLEGMPRPWAPAGAKTEKEAARSLTSGALVHDRVFLAAPEPRNKSDAHHPKSYVRVGALRVPLDENDAERIEHWESKRGNEMKDGDLIPVRITKVDTEKGHGRKAVIETTEMAQLAQRPEIQGALLAVDPANGHLTAMVGGYDYDLSQFNRATQAKRQAGSSIKPYIYSAAVENGYTEVSIVYDAPIKVKTAAGFWSPHNYKNDYLGPITLRTALQHSINTVSVRLVEALGVDKVIEQIRKFGITAQIVRHPSIALGTPEVTLIEHTYGYATFPAGGLEVTPVVIEKIMDADGTIIEEEHPVAEKDRKRRIPADTNYVMIDLMKNVVEKGTGQKAKELGRPAGGKTGTSNDFKDNWFMAYTRDLVCGVWVGRDDFKSIGNDATGGTTAAPIWTEFMKAGHPNTPVRDFDAPPGIYFVRGTPDNGRPARPGTPNSILLPFKRGTLPPEFARTDKGHFSDEVF